MVKKLYKGKKIKWGIAGCGRFAENSFLPAVRLTRRTAVTALYSRDINRAKSLAEKFGIQNSFDNYDDFLKSDFEKEAEDFELFWYAKPMDKLRENGLLVL